MLLVLLCLSVVFLLVAIARAYDSGCGLPGLPLDGQAIPLRQKYFKVGESVHYHCKPTYFLLGNPNRTCGLDSKWTGSVPVCLRPAKQDEKSWEFQDRTTLLKHDITSEQRTLFADQNPSNITFSASFDRLWGWHINCALKSSGVFEQGTGYHVTYDCSFKTSPGQKLTLYFKSKSDLLSICEIYLFFRTDEGKCDTPDTPLNGKIERVDAQSFYFLCDYGPVLNGCNFTTCAANGSWTELTPMCYNHVVADSSLNSKTETELNLIHLYMGLGGLALLIVFILGVGLITRVVQRHKQLETLGHGCAEQYGRSNSGSPVVAPSRDNVHFPLPRHANTIPPVPLRTFCERASPNHYSIAVIPGESPPHNRSAVTDEHVYENCITGSSQDLIKNCNPKRNLPQPPKTRFSQLTSFKNH